MILKKLGFYKKPLRGTSHDLTLYSVDKFGNVWSNNKKTYVTRYGKDIREGQGLSRMVTMRDYYGNKVSVSRKKLQKAFMMNQTYSF